jgi:DNA-directed RNA polymerase subunit RPC12/RpoP
MPPSETGLAFENPGIGFERRPARCAVSDHSGSNQLTFVALIFERGERDSLRSTGEGVAPVSNEQTGRPNDLPPCSRCKTRVVEVVSIAPTQTEPGLIAYECPRCGHVGSVLLQPLPKQH